MLIVHVQDIQGRPIKGARVAVRGASNVAAPSDVAGVSRIRLSPETKSSSWVSLQLVEASSDLVLLSPMNGRVHVPSFDNESVNFIEVVLVKRGDHAGLYQGALATDLAKKIIAETKPKVPDAAPQNIRYDEALRRVAKEFGLQPSEIDSAIKGIVKTSKDPIASGISNLYAGKALEAERQLDQAWRQFRSAEAAASARATEAAFYLGRARFDQGKFAEALRSLDEVVSIDPGNRDAQILRAFTLMNLSRLADAKSVLLGLRSQIDSGDARMPGILTALGEVHQALGLYYQSESYHLQALEILTRQKPQDGYEIASVLTNLAVVLERKGDFERATRYYHQAITFFERYEGDGFTELARCLNDQAKLLVQMQRFEEARQAYNRALDLDLKNGRQEHPDTATTMGSLATVLFILGDYSNAEKMSTKALDIHFLTLGPDNLQVATIYNNLAQIKELAGETSAARSLYSKSLAIKLSVQGRRTRDYGVTLANLAGLHESQGELEQAEKLYREVLQIDEEVLGAEHYEIAADLKNLAQLIEARGRRDEAIGLYRRALNIAIFRFGANSPQAAELRAKLNGR